MSEPDEHQRLVQETARKYAQDSLAPVATQLDREGRFPAEQLRELAELGMMGVNIPEDYGGAQAGAVAYALAMMEIAQGCASTAVTMAVTNMVGETIVKFGTPEQRRRYVPELTSGRFAAGSFGLSEPSGGSDAAALRTPGPGRTPSPRSWSRAASPACAWASTRTRWACAPRPPSRWRSRTCASAKTSSSARRATGSPSPWRRWTAGASGSPRRRWASGSRRCGPR